MAQFAGSFAAIRIVAAAVPTPLVDWLSLGAVMLSAAPQSWRRGSFWGFRAAGSDHFGTRQPWGSRLEPQATGQIGIRSSGCVDVDTPAAEAIGDAQDQGAFIDAGEMTRESVQLGDGVR